MENVKVIKLSKTKIDIDGIIYVREQPEYKQGKWYIAYCSSTKYLIRYDKTINVLQSKLAIISFEFIPFDSDSLCFGGHFDCIERPATDSEVEAHLIKVAVARK